MPTVPRYEGNSVQERQVPDVRVISQLPEGVASGGIESRHFDLAQKIVSSEAEKADRAQILIADKDLSDLETRLLYDAKDGIISKKGRDVFSAPEYVADKWKKGVEDISKRLSGHRQKRLFGELSQKRFDSINSTVQRHVATESINYANSVTDEYLASERDAAAINFGSPERIGLSIERQRAAIADFADRNGKPPEWTSNKLREVESKTHMAVLERMLAGGDDRLAKAYYDANKEGFSLADDAKRAVSILEEGSVRGESQRISDSILGEAKTLTEAISKTKDVSDPKLRDAVSDRVREGWNLKKVAEKDYQNSLYEEAAKYVDASPGKKPRYSVPPGVWADLSTEYRDALDKRASDGPNDDEAWLDFLDQYRGSPDTIGKLSRHEFEVKFWSKFDKAHRNRAESMWNDAADGARSGKSSPTQSTMSFEERLQNTLVLAKMIPSASQGKLKGEKLRLYARAENKASIAIDDFTNKNKRKPTQEEMQSLIDDAVFDEGTVSGLFSNKQKPFVSMEVGADVEVPESEGNQIRGWFKSRGITPTDRQVKDAYIAYKQGDRALLRKVLTK